MTLKEKIAAARAADPTLTDNEIWQKVQTSSEYKNAKDNGAQDDEIIGRLGLTVKPAAGTGAAAAATGPTGPSGPSGPGLADSVAHGAAIVGSGLTKGAVEGSLGLPGTIMAAEKKYLPDSVNNALKNPILGTIVNGPLSLIQNLTGKDVLPTGQSLEGHLNDLGLNAEPRNTLEAQLDAGSRGVGAAAVTLPLGGAGVATTLGSGALSGEGSYLGGRIGANWGHEDAGSLIGGLVGGLAGAGPVAQKIGNNLVKKTIGGAEGSLSDAALGVDAAQSALGEAKAAHAKLQNAGTDLSLANQKNLLNMSIEHQELIKNTNANRDAQIKAVTEPAQNAIAAHADALGPSDTPQALGTTLQEHGTNYVDDFDNKQQKIWNPIDSQVPNNTVHQPTALANILGQMNERAGVLQPLVNMVRSTLPQRMGNVLEGIQNGVESGLVPPITYGDARVLRTAFGKALTNPKLLPDLSSSEKSAIYGAMTEDLRSTLKPLGLADAFDSANAASTKLYSFVKNELTPILGDGKNMPAPETVASRLVGLGSKGGTKFAALREQMPEAVDDMASYIIRSGKWSSLAPEAKEGLVPDPTVRASLDANHSALETGAAPIKAQAAQTISDNEDRIAQIKEIQDRKRIEHGEAVSASTKELAKHTENLRSAQEAQKSAKAMLDTLKEATTGKGSQNLMGIKTLLASDVAGQVGDLVLQSVGDPLATGLKLAVRGVPFVKYGVNALRRNPMLLGEGARGAYVGAVENNANKKNALAP